MKKNILYIAFIYASLWMIEMAFSFCLKSNVNIKASYVSRKKINADVLFLGTSNTLLGISPDVFEQETGKIIYNLATNHSSFEENLAHLHLYLKNNLKPKLLVIGISISDLTISHWAFHSYFFAPFTSDSLIKNLIKKNDPFYYYLSYLPFAKYAYYNEYVNAFAFKGLTHILGRDTIAYFQKGTYYTTTGASGVDHFRETANSYNHHIKYRFDANEEQQLRCLLEYAKNKNIPVLLYEPIYWSVINKDYVGRGETILHLQNIAKKYHSEYWTFDTLSICKKRENFYTVFHTNEFIAKDFTKIFAEKLCARDNNIKVE